MILKYLVEFEVVKATHLLGDEKPTGFKDAPNFRRLVTFVPVDDQVKIAIAEG